MRRVTCVPGYFPIWGRTSSRFYHNEPHPEKSLYWFFANANKRGVTLNLRTADGHKIFKRLVQQADLVVESFPPGQMKELGLGYSALSRTKPDIVLTSISPFGQSGPYVHYKVSDIVCVSLGGMTNVFGEPDRAPVRISAPQAYFIGAQHGAMGSLLALYHRDLTGEGQCVDVSIQEAVMFSLTYSLPFYEQRKLVRGRSGPFYSTPRRPPLGTLHARRLFHCKDGDVCLAFQGGNRAAINSSRAIVAWANEEGYALALKDYNWDRWSADVIEQDEQERIEGEILSFLLTKTKSELLESAARRRILLAPVSTAADLPENPQLHFREFWVKVSHPELNSVLTYPGVPFKIEAMEQGIYRRAPLLGEHNREIYQGEMALSSQELNLLKGQGVI
jgi:crotonobetainyl-CoA:carnitine CoA-transferase CaiB-like acyl-CoA transferase